MSTHSCSLSFGCVGRQPSSSRTAFFKTPRSTAAFTLIELLVVVAIIGLLLAILAPSLASAREQARRTVCASNLRQVATGIYNYWTVNNGRVPYLFSSITNNYFGTDSVPDADIDPFDRVKWALSLPNALTPTHLSESRKMFICPSALNGWPRDLNKSPGYQYTYKESAINQTSGVTSVAGTYDREVWGFMDGRMLNKLRVEYNDNPSSPQDYVKNSQMTAATRSTYVRDLIQMRKLDSDPVVGPHSGGIMVIDRDMQVRFRSQKIATEDLAPNWSGARF